MKIPMIAPTAIIGAIAFSPTELTALENAVSTIRVQMWIPEQNRTRPFAMANDSGRPGPRDSPSVDREVPGC